MMTTVTRKVISKPSNSKSPGATHHIEISGKTFAAAAEQRGSGWATAIVDGETARLQVAATYLVGKQGRKERIVAEADVIVTDGFTGNIVLKMGESIYNIMKEQGMVNEFVDRTNYENYGGSPIIGINGNVIIAHGASSPTAIMNMIKLCQNIVKSEVAKKIKAAFENN